MLLRQQESTSLRTQLVHVLIADSQQIVIYVLHGNAFGLCDIPHALQSRSRVQTRFRFNQLRTRAGRIFNYVRQHLPIETAVNIERLHEHLGTVPETRQICPQIIRHLLFVPGIAEDIVDKQILAVALGAKAVRRIVVRIATKHHHQSRRDERGRMQKAAG